MQITLPKQILFHFICNPKAQITTEVKLCILLNILPWDNIKLIEYFLKNLCVHVSTDYVLCIYLLFICINSLINYVINPTSWRKFSNIYLLNILEASYLTEYLTEPYCNKCLMNLNESHKIIHWDLFNAQIFIPIAKSLVSYISNLNNNFLT